MQNCPACGDAIGDDCEICPYCGINVVDSQPESRGMTAMLTILIVAAGAVALLYVGFLSWPSPRTPSQRSQCKNNLKQIGLALHNYHDTYGVLPPTYIADKNGKPMHSWRVLILPYLDEAPLYKQYRFDEPWDGPNNSKLLTRCPKLYRCPSSVAGDTSTPYLAVSGEHAAFGLGKSVSFRDFSDGLSNTIMVGEADQPAVLWMQPVDIDADDVPIGKPGGFNSRHTDGFHVLLSDGAVRFVSQNISSETFLALLTRDGGETVGEY